MAESLLSQLKTDNGTSVAIKDLTALVAGILVTSLSSGYAALIAGAIESFVIAPASGVGDFLGDFVEAVIGIPAAVASGSWGASIGFVRTFGVLALPIAVLLVIILAYLVSEGWSLRG